MSRAAEPVIWALVGTVAGQLVQRTPDGVRVVVGGGPGVLEQSGGFGRRRRRILVIPLGYLVGLTCAELRVVIARELGLVSGGRRITAASDAVGRRLVGVERRRSVLRHPARRFARTFFGVTASRAHRRAVAAEDLAAGLYGRETVARAASRTESLDVAFDWFWEIEVRPFLDRGWRPPLAWGFRMFLDSPLVTERLPGLASDAPTGDVLGSTEAVEAGLLDGSLAGLGWQEGSVRVVMSVWDGHARRESPRGDGIRVREVGQAVVASVEALGGDQARLQVELAGLGASLALTLVDAGWLVGKLPGRAATLAKDGVVVRPHEEIAGLWSGRVTGATWIDRCRQLGIGDLRLPGQGILAVMRPTSGPAPSGGGSVARPVVRT